jgi:ferredoxin-NADP reductase
MRKMLRQKEEQDQRYRMLYNSRSKQNLTVRNWTYRLQFVLEGLQKFGQTLKQAKKGQRTKLEILNLQPKENKEKLLHIINIPNPLFEHHNSIAYFPKNHEKEPFKNFQKTSKKDE